MTNVTGSATKPAPWDLEVTPAVVRKISIVCFIAWVVSVYDFTLFGTLLPVIAEDFGWTTAESTTINTVLQVGVFIVSLVVGTIIDRLGRRNALIILMLGGALASGFTGLAMGAVSMVLIRSITGLSLSEEVVNAVYLNEIYRKVRNKGFLYSLVQAGYPIGALVAAGMSALLLPVIGWRWSFVIAGVFALLVALLATRLPESPTFAAMKEVRRRTDAGDLQGAERLRREHELEDDDHEKVGLKGVFTRELWLHTTLLSAAWLFSWVAIQVFSVLGTTVLVEAKGVTFENALLILVGANAVGFVGYLVHGWVGDRIGRRATVVIGWGLGTIASVIMLLGPSVQAFILVMYALTLFFLTGPFAALLYYMGESFPANVRGMGTNVAHVMAPLGSILGSGLLSVYLVAGLDMSWAALLSGTAGLALAAICMFGTRRVHHSAAKQ
ncbi:MFS transporter [Salinibacterium sp. dk2585]|uniref:MFS transporter n=1 Tax=unclassified Salinibacterium TaxID=2632331 RepID=UPI0011C25711|nr:MULTISPECIES: MFS transporter [unclassified Salinibacterium]QEE62322.1 MFS transporter [Salinibacterium sp. dk2585]TXK53673.1 MFS transporter [Salinibacterium sp. dk5596]